MKYADARDSIQTGDIFAQTHTGWGSRGDIESQIVRIFTRSEFSHCGIFWVFGGRVFVIEAVVPFVRIVPVSLFPSFYWLPMNKPLNEVALEYLLSLVGWGVYGKWEAVRGFLGWNNKNNRIVQCSEITRSALVKNGNMQDGIDTPTDVIKDAMDGGAHLIKVIV